MLFPTTVILLDPGEIWTPLPLVLAMLLPSMVSLLLLPIIYTAFPVLMIVLPATSTLLEPDSVIPLPVLCESAMVRPAIVTLLVLTTLMMRLSEPTSTFDPVKPAGAATLIGLFTGSKYHSFAELSWLAALNT